MCPAPPEADASGWDGEQRVLVHHRLARQLGRESLFVALGVPADVAGHVHRVRPHPAGSFAVSATSRRRG
jgi:hypothetical protein